MKKYKLAKVKPKELVIIEEILKGWKKRDLSVTKILKKVAN